MPQGQSPSLLAKAEQIAREFDISPDHVRRVTEHFVGQLKDGLANARPWQLPTYVRSIPTGTEKGEFLAVDLGGSNCRICLVNLKGDSTFDVTQSKHIVPLSVMVCSSYRPLFDFIAQKLKEFLEKRQGLAGQPYYSLGFTFSFTCEQTSLASGRLIHWDKGWNIPDALGRDPCSMLQDAIDKQGLPVRVTVLANDSVGALLTRSYVSGPTTSTLAAMIFGTGTNAAYVEKLANVRRLAPTASSDEIMVMNTEWGCFDDKLEVLPRAAFDDELDAASTDPGSQMLEKRVSGLYLGELLRLTIIQLHRLGAFTMEINEKSACFQRDGIDSSFVSKLAATGRAESVISLVQDTLSAENTTTDDTRAIQLIAHSIARRAARLAGASLAALVIQSGRLQSSYSESEFPDSKAGQDIITETSSRTSVHRFWQSLGLLWQRLLKFIGICPVIRMSLGCRLQQNLSEGCAEEEIIDVGADGSLIEFYPTFETEMRIALREVPQVGAAGEKRVRINLTKDGSGVGAALIAQAASRTGKIEYQGAPTF
ncbi:putative glucokinase [Aspergillus granulosus]|uniref:Phosphotransferase n=1 Tax=Aspergillus granulosus TaxID=176169 RepID=A0ABR4H829_9EURO